MNSFSDMLATAYKAAVCKLHNIKDYEDIPMKDVEITISEYNTYTFVFKSSPIVSHGINTCPVIRVVLYSNGSIMEVI